MDANVYGCRMMALAARRATNQAITDDVLAGTIFRLISMVDADLYHCWRVKSAIALGRSLLLLGRPSEALDQVERLIWHDDIVGASDLTITQTANQLTP
jgi:hypothetical protein